MLKYKSSLFFIALIISAISLVTSSCGSKHGTERVLKLAHGLDPSHSVHIAMEFMGKRMEELSGGKMKLDIYPSGQLGSEPQCIELLQLGSLAITKVSSGTLESFVDPFRLFGLPYLFHSKEHFHKVLDGEIGEKLLLTTEPYLIRGLGYYDSGARSFYTTSKPILKPEDLSGLKIRVMKSPLAVEMMQRFKGSATPISWGELYTALQSGVVDGAENNFPSFVLSHHNEVCKHYSLNEHTMLPDIIVISKHVWDDLSEQEQKWLSTALKESVTYQRELWEISEKECLEEAIKSGVKIYYPDKAPFIELVKPMYENFGKYPEIYPLIAKIADISNE